MPPSLGASTPGSSPFAASLGGGTSGTAPLLNLAPIKPAPAAAVAPLQLEKPTIALDAAPSASASASTGGWSFSLTPAEYQAASEAATLHSPRVTAKRQQQRQQACANACDYVLTRFVEAEARTLASEAVRYLSSLLDGRKGGYPMWLIDLGERRDGSASILFRCLSRWRAALAEASARRAAFDAKRSRQRTAVLASLEVDAAQHGLAGMRLSVPSHASASRPNAAPPGWGGAWGEGGSVQELLLSGRGVLAMSAAVDENVPPVFPNHGSGGALTLGSPATPAWGVAQPPTTTLHLHDHHLRQSSASSGLATAAPLPHALIGPAPQQHGQAAAHPLVPPTDLQVGTWAGAWAGVNEVGTRSAWLSQQSSSAATASTDCRGAGNAAGNAAGGRGGGGDAAVGGAPLTDAAVQYILRGGGGEGGDGGEAVEGETDPAPGFGSPGDYGTQGGGSLGRLLHEISEVRDDVATNEGTLAQQRLAHAPLGKAHAQLGKVARTTLLAGQKRGPPVLRMTGRGLVAGSPAAPPQPSSERQGGVVQRALQDLQRAREERETRDERMRQLGF